MQLEVGLVAGVERGHQGAPELGVAQAQSVADLMGGHDPQIRAAIGAFGPELIVVKVDNPGFGCLGVGQYVTCGGWVLTVFNTQPRFQLSRC